MAEPPNLPAGYSLTIPSPQPGGRKVAEAETEQMLQVNIVRQEEALGEALFALARFYQQTRRHPLAMEVLNRISDLVREPEPKAVCYLSMGQLAEGMGDFEGAVDYYSQAFLLEPARIETWYLINNNLGYALNQLGRNVEAEGYCRAAIKIDPKRYNAYKNLGISQEGQGALAEAAASYIQAVRKEAADSRALNLLERLLAHHPQLLKQNPALVSELENCRDAVSFARCGA